MKGRGGIRSWRALPLLGALVFPALVGGLAYVCARGQALGTLSDGWAVTGTAVAMLVTVVVFLFGLGSDSFASNLAGAAAFIGVLLVTGAVGHSVLAERGVEVTCVVRGIDVRTEVSWTTDAQGHSTSETRTYYDHDLDCPPGGPDELDGRSGRAAEVGAELAVVYDPQGKVSPMPARSVDPDARRMWALIALGASTLLAVAGALD
ncbi:hypothetical protein [Streptomyces sp. NPDC048603]|uniref:hypothetical protein n=1 Tax=Streptomyces sp. NPDC048603 TaxID=3365577 RepID=UPI00371ACE7B